MVLGLPVVLRCDLFSKFFRLTSAIPLDFHAHHAGSIKVNQMMQLISKDFVMCKAVYAESIQRILK